MSNFDELFVANYECTVQECRRKEELDVALARYNDLFVPSSKKRLKLVSEAI